MQRRFENRTRGELFVERAIEYVVWHAAAGAALAVMVLVLLSSLQWLDRVAPAAPAGVQVARPLTNPGEPTPEFAVVNRPSG